jgi:hypothetical protein
MEPIAEVGAIAELLDSLSVAAERVSNNPGELALLAGQLRDRRDELP